MRRIFNAVPITTLFTASLISLYGGMAQSIEFNWGVASGDPEETSVVLWSKVDDNSSQQSKEKGEETTIRWEVGLSSDMTTALWDPVKNGSTTTNSSLDWTIKLVVEGLEPAKTYYYRFFDDNNSTRSPIGRTRTLPDSKRDLETISFAIASCINYQEGYFTALDHIRGSTDLFGVIFLGDFIYEYGPDGPFSDGSPIGRPPDPPTEAYNLTAYRNRYAQYRNTTSLSEAMRWFPWIMVWDDHEFANNAWKTGALNNQPSKEGPWRDRKDDAITAYLEYTPVRAQKDPNNETVIFRSFRFGRLMELMMLDTRIYGRDPANVTSNEVIESWNRTIMGYSQELWLNNTLQEAENNGVKWKVLGNQVMFTALTIETLDYFDKTLLRDSWNGYPANRQRLKGFIAEQNIKNVIWATGDIHTSWINDVQYEHESKKENIGLELVTPSVTAPQPINQGVILSAAEEAINAAEEQVRWVELQHHGYYQLIVTPQNLMAKWYFVEDITKKDSAVFLAHTLEVNVSKVGASDSKSGAIVREKGAQFSLVQIVTSGYMLLLSLGWAAAEQ